MTLRSTAKSPTLSVQITEAWRVAWAICVMLRRSPEAMVGYVLVGFAPCWTLADHG